MREILTTLADVLAVALVVAGVACLSVPGALIVAGVLVGFLSWRAARPAAGDGR